MVLKAYWPLDEDSGSTAKDVRGGNDGTINGATMGANGILGTTAYDFDGDNDYVSIYHPTRPFTVACWANSDVADGSDDQVVTFHDDSSWALTIRNIDNTWKCWSGSNITGLAVEPGEWVHLSATWNGSILTFYINGVPQGTLNALGTTSSTDLDAIGGDHDNGNMFNGRISDVRIYDHALTQQEIQYLYQVGERGLHTSDKRSL